MSDKRLFINCIERGLAELAGLDKIDAPSNPMNGQSVNCDCWFTMPTIVDFSPNDFNDLSEILLLGYAVNDLQIAITGSGNCPPNGLNEWRKIGLRAFLTIADILLRNELIDEKYQDIINEIKVKERL